jgi:hypothetical protein
VAFAVASAFAFVGAALAVLRRRTVVPATTV